MLLAVDLGNTNLTVGVFDAGKLTRRFRLETVRTRTVDEYAALLMQQLMVHQISADLVRDSIIASVVPQLTGALCNAIELAFNLQPIVVGPGIKTGVPVICDNPHEVGADRIVNAVAAYERHRAATIVVDFGTATNFDCVSAAGEYVGGVIVPGINVSLDALMSRAARLRPVELAVPPTVIGRNTTHALQSGVIFGFCCLIDGLVGKLKAELACSPCHVIATGGLAPLLSPESEVIESVDLDLTLEGLRLLYERNRGRRASSPTL